VLHFSQFAYAHLAHLASAHLAYAYDLGRQVKRARLSQGWRRRNRLAAQQEEQRRTTAGAVANALASGGRNYGRNYMSTALRLEGHRAQFDDIAHELQR
jgi:hypothetical protein